MKNEYFANEFVKTRYSCLRLVIFKCLTTTHVYCYSITLTIHFEPTLHSTPSCVSRLLVFTYLLEAKLRTTAVRRQPEQSGDIQPSKSHISSRFQSPVPSWD